MSLSNCLSWKSIFNTDDILWSLGSPIESNFSEIGHKLNQVFDKNRKTYSCTFLHRPINSNTKLTRKLRVIPLFIVRCSLWWNSHLLTLQDWVRLEGELKKANAGQDWRTTSSNDLGRLYNYYLDYISRERIQTNNRLITKGTYLYKESVVTVAKYINHYLITRLKCCYCLCLILATTTYLQANIFLHVSLSPLIMLAK